MLSSYVDLMPFQNVLKVLRRNCDLTKPISARLAPLFGSAVWKARDVFQFQITKHQHKIFKIQSITH